MLHKSNFSIEAAFANCSGAMEADTISKNGASLKKLIVFCITICFSASLYAQQASEQIKPKAFYHAVDSFYFDSGYGDHMKLKFVVFNSNGDSKTFNRIAGYFWYNENKEKYMIDIKEYDPDINKFLCVFRSTPPYPIYVTPNAKLETFLKDKGTNNGNIVKMAEDCNITITNAIIKPNYLVHAVDTIETFKSGSAKSVLYIVSTNGDSKTFNCIIGYVSKYDMELSGLEWKKVVIDVYRYKASSNTITFSWRNRDNFGSMDATSKIAAYLQGKGKNAKGEIIKMAEDCSIRISE